MKQTVEQRRHHHQTREDRQRKALDVLKWRILKGTRLGYNTQAAARDLANLNRKLGLS